MLKALHDSADGLCIPAVRGEAVIYDPRGKDIPMPEFFEFDNFLFNSIMGAYENGPVTAARLDRLTLSCQRYMKMNSPGYEPDNEE